MTFSYIRIVPNLTSEIERDLTEIPKKQRENTKTPPKTSITQRLRTDLGRSVGGNDSHPTGVAKPVYGIPTFPLTAKAV